MALLEVNDLRTSFFTDAGEVKAVNGISFNLERGKVLGIVGESGSGKSVTAYSIMQILASTGKIVGGSIKLDGQELVGAGEKVMKTVRGNKVSIIFQDPMTSLNPTYTIGHQLVEAIMLHTDRDRKQAWDRAVEMLRLVNVNEPERRMKQYPFEHSGGMRQRVMIAMALACEPDILIADEPTTALDVTIQAQILELMQQLQKEIGMAIIMITHDLGVVARAGHGGRDLLQSPPRIHQGPPALHPHGGHRRSAAAADRRHAHRPAEHARGLPLRAPVRRGHEDLHSPALRAHGDQRRSRRRLLDERESGPRERHHHGRKETGRR